MISALLRVHSADIRYEYTCRRRHAINRKFSSVSCALIAQRQGEHTLQNAHVNVILFSGFSVQHKTAAETSRQGSNILQLEQTFKILYYLLVGAVLHYTNRLQ